MLKHLLTAVAIPSLVTVAMMSTVRLSDGDPSRGRVAFMDLRCHACHRVAEDASMPGYPGAWDGPLLHDLGKQKPEEVAWKIVCRTSLDPEGVYDEPMSESASAINEQQLADIVAYLRNPRAARH